SGLKRFGPARFAAHPPKVLPLPAHPYTITGLGGMFFRFGLAFWGGSVFRFLGYCFSGCCFWFLLFQFFFASQIYYYCFLRSLVFSTVVL
ncbi:hypothetical protein, partial [Diplocloster agilis]|uniref:hypothetical protein n=1 Tax=Diplocloster agilis TaxID=2850323 RepID=UPI002265D822